MKIKNTFVFLTFGWFCLSPLALLARGTDADYTKIDAHARQAPDKIRYDIDRLTKYLSKPAKNDFEKVRAFYTWIADNIAYDVQLFRNYRPSRYQPLSPTDVLKKRKAVCQGYAELFQEMCKRVGIISYVVPGYSKGFGYVPKARFTTADHAWNAVKIENVWHLIDVTWGSGGLDEQTKFVKEFNEKYFLSDPNTFVLNHLPVAPLWQLLDCPVPIKVYASGEEPIKNYLTSSKDQCLDYRKLIEEFEGKRGIERSLFVAEMSYKFNPDNPVLLARVYMDQANQLMLSIPRQLRSREAIVQATETQEEALAQLRRAQDLLKAVNDDSANQEKVLVAKNITTSQQNLKGLRNAIK